MFITTDAKKFETSLPALIMPKSFFMPLSFSPVLVERSALSSSRASSAICGRIHEGKTVSSCVSSIGRWYRRDRIIGHGAAGGAGIRKFTPSAGARLT